MLACHVFVLHFCVRTWFDLGPERLSKQRLRHQSCEFHFDMTPGKSVSRVPSRVVISTTWLSLLATRTSWFVAAAMLVEV